MLRLKSAFTQKQNQAQQRASFNIARSSNVAPLASRQEHPILQLQRAIGNQAVQRLLQAELIGLEAHDHTQDTTRFAHYVSQIPVYSKAPVKLQAKLTGNPGDIYEQEADRVAEQVVRVPEPRFQRTCACGGECSKCQTEKLAQGPARLQTKHVGSGDLGRTAVPPSVYKVLRSPGQSLDPEIRAFMEPRLGHDYSQVRVHTDAKAAESARALNARAYTVGNDVAFGSGQYAPQTSDGRRLLAHELTHVLQQSTSFVRLQRTPDTKDTVQKQYDITIEKGDKNWTEDEIKLVQAALARLSAKDKGIVKGYKFVRWSNPEAREKKDPTYMKPATSQENCLHEYDSVKGIYRITAYDGCLGDPEARAGSDVTYGIATGQVSLLHEIGHAAQHAEHRRAIMAREAADKALMDVQNKYKKPEERQKHKTELEELEKAVRVASEAIRDVNDRAFTEFKKLMKGKKIMATVPTSTEDPSKYTDADYKEAFAEIFAAYVADPAFVKKDYPEVYKWLQKNKHLEK